ncbi:MAG: FAD-dependent oxidoreductase [Candidatus Doudnabacteria bacterium]|nr:FAD-dependent oxidoreductase [Candidatus Doudnabacteria bacterium]
MYDIIVVGGGVAAFSSALFAARRGLEILVIAKDIGGQANYTDLIENYPGLPEIGGLELVSRIKQQAEAFGAKVLIAEVTKIKQHEQSFVATAYNRQYKSKALILAFGKTPKDLAVPGEEQFKGRGVSYCATCDAPLCKNKTVAVAGIGDLSLEAAILLSHFAKKVYVLSKTDKLHGHLSLIKALHRRKNVEFLPFKQVLEIKGSKQLSSMRLRDLNTGVETSLPIEAIFVELGYVVHSEFLGNLLDLEQDGQVRINADHSTSVAGLFAAGDVTDRPYKQAVISAGEGASAALAAFDWLMRQKGSTGLTSDWTQIKRVNR